MTDEAMSPLRRRMIEDMTIRKFAPKTQHDYVQRVKTSRRSSGDPRIRKRTPGSMSARRGGIPCLPSMEGTKGQPGPCD